MGTFSVTLIDVGWGDSIFLEYKSENSKLYALVDCNDTNVSRSSFLYVKRYLEKHDKNYRERERLFDFILLTHSHTDHVCGIKQMMSYFGTDWYWYPKSDLNSAFFDTLRYAKNSDKVRRFQSVSRRENLPDFGDVEMKVLWPPYSESPEPYDSDNPNNNSVVLLLSLDKVRFVLTGDCEAENWKNIKDKELKSRVKMFKFPHHGAQNGLFDENGDTPWLDRLGVRTKLGMSLHVRHGHPHPEVITELENRNFKQFRTDQHYHVTFETNGKSVQTKWSRF